MIVSSSPSTTSVPRWNRLRPTPRRIGHWLNGLSITLLLCWLCGWLLGRYYPFELFSHFQLQYYGAALVLLVAGFVHLLAFGKRGAAGFTLVPTLVFTLVILFTDAPWLPGNPTVFTSEPPGDVRVFHANVLYTRHDYEPTLALLRNQRPNFYVLQEMTPQSIRLVTSRLRGEFPHWFACWSKGPCWMLVGSRTPIRVDRSLASQNQIIALTTRINGQDVSLVTVHPRTPLLPSWFRERNDQLTFAARKTRRNAQPTLLIGDFNISVFSPVYGDIFSPSEPADNVKNGANVKPIAAAGILRPTRNRLTQPTWPTFFPPMMIPIDHAFVNGGFYPIRFQTLDHPGSDHRAVVIDLAFSR